MSDTIRFKSLAFRISLTRRCTWIFSIFHTFSIIFKSGLCAGQGRVFILFSSFQRLALTETWHGALSSWKIQSRFEKCLAYSGVQHIFCCVLLCFLRLVYPMLAVSLDCPPLSVPSVFSNVYLEGATVCF
jgi:hypothetical protein